MRVVINGDDRDVKHGASIADLLRDLALDPRMVVVEHNRAIVRRPQLAEVHLEEGDRIELVHFVGGG